MGTINLLNASVNGKIGELYGTKQYGNSYLKAIPFSHSPHNETQEKCVRAFEKLNRFSSGIAKVFFNYMGLNNRKMLKHNAVAQLFKPIIQNKSFIINNITKIIKKDGTTKVTALKIDKENSLITASFETSEKINKKLGSAWVCFIMNSNGKVLIADCPNEQIKTLSVSTVIENDVFYWAGSFRADKINNRVNLHGWNLFTINVVLNGLLYVDLLERGLLYRVENGLLIIDDTSVNVENNKLIIN